MCACVRLCVYDGWLGGAVAWRVATTDAPEGGSVCLAAFDPVALTPHAATTLISKHAHGSLKPLALNLYPCGVEVCAVTTSRSAGGLARPWPVQECAGVCRLVPCRSWASVAFCGAHLCQRGHLGQDWARCPKWNPGKD